MIEDRLEDGHVPHSRLHLKIKPDATTLQRSIMRNDLQNKLGGGMKTYVYDSEAASRVTKEAINNVQIFNIVVATVVFIIALF